MPLADEASKLLAKQGKDGTVKFDNPAVGDFQVLDALVEVSGEGEHVNIYWYHLGEHSPSTRIHS